MKNIAVKITETLTRTVIVKVNDDETYADAEEKACRAYNNCNIILDADTSAIDVNFEDDTENYIEIFGAKDFQLMGENIR